MTLLWWRESNQWLLHLWIMVSIILLPSTLSPSFPFLIISIQPSILSWLILKRPRWSLIILGPLLAEQNPLAHFLAQPKSHLDKPNFLLATKWKPKLFFIYFFIFSWDCQCQLYPTHHNNIISKEIKGQNIVATCNSVTGEADGKSHLLGDKRRWFELYETSYGVCHDVLIWVMIND